MAKSRKTEKTIEIHEFYVFRTESGSFPALCEKCSSGKAIMVTPEQAATVAHVPVRTIYSWVELGLVHYREGSSGSLTVCLSSLPDAGGHPNHAETPCKP